MLHLNRLKELFNEFFVFKRGRSYGHGWNKVRNEYISKNPCCAICGFNSLDNDVHHIIPRHIDPKLLLEEINLMTLCRKYRCHLRFGHFGNYKRYYNPDIRNLTKMGALMVESENQAKSQGLVE